MNSPMLEYRRAGLDSSWGADGQVDKDGGDPHADIDCATADGRPHLKAGTVGRTQEVCCGAAVVGTS